jgi:hypothetical protein
MVQCALCDHADDVSIVPHIREKHSLKVYLSLFPDLPIVNKALYAAIENAVFFRYVDDTPGLESISLAERELILTTARNNAHLRSEIIITSDF